MENQKYTHYIKIQGKANIPCPLATGHNFEVVADCSITEKKEIDNQDGTYDMVYKAEPLTISISKDNGPVIKARDPRRNSEKLRKYLWKLWSDHKGVTFDFQDVYSEVTLVAMLHMPELLDEAVHRLDQKEWANFPSSKTT